MRECRRLRAPLQYVETVEETVRVLRQSYETVDPVDVLDTNRVVDLDPDARELTAPADRPGVT